MTTRTILGLCIVGLTACGGRGGALSDGELAPGSPHELTEALGAEPVVAEDQDEQTEASDGAAPAGSGDWIGVTPAQPEPAPWPHEQQLTEPAPSDLCAGLNPTYPETGWSPEPWEPHPAADAAEMLRAVQAAMPGQWHGQVTTPWTTPYRVDLRFGADGSYSARCSDIPAECCLAFYYGSDDDTPIKRYRVDDATLSGTVFGEIDIAFEYGDEYGLPAWQGELTNVERDASGNGLRFRFQRSDGYGPVEYDLRRVTEP